MADFQNTIDLLGDETVSVKIISKEIEEFADDLVSKLGEYAFYYCTRLTSVDLPNVTSVDSNVFVGCSKLTSVNFPSLKGVGTSMFEQCSLTSIDLPSATSINAAAFHSCSKLTILILRSQTLCTLSNTNALFKTPFASGGTGGTVYVPQALISQYQQATNWSTLYAGGKCNFVAIEGSEYE